MPDSVSRVLLTTDHIRAWEDECARLTTEIDERVARRAKVMAKLKAVHDLLDEVVVTSPIAPPPTTVTISSSEPRRRRPKSGLPTWLDEIEKIVADEEMGVTYDDLRAGIELGPLAQRLRESDKGFYGGIGKLTNAGRIVKHNGRLFAPRMHERFMQKVAAGFVEDLPAPPSASRTRSPMGDAILAFVETRPNGASSGDIVQELLRHEAFAATVGRNKTAAYNVVKRLFDRGQIRKAEGRYYAL